MAAACPKFTSPLFSHSAGVVSRAPSPPGFAAPAPVSAPTPPRLLQPQPWLYPGNPAPSRSLWLCPSTLASRSAAVCTHNTRMWIEIISRILCSAQQGAGLVFSFRLLQ